MRSFEAAAMGGCLLVEETVEHREIFGADGEAVVYFRSIQEMQTRATWLASQPAERHRLARTARSTITRGVHTYADRLTNDPSVPGRLTFPSLSSCHRLRSPLSSTAAFMPWISPASSFARV